VQSSLSSWKDSTISQTIAGVIAVSGPDGGPMSCCGASAAWGQGLATRAVLLAVGWLIRERGADVVEPRVGRDSPACQRIAVKSGFPLGGTVSSVVEATGTVAEDLRCITGAGEQRMCHQQPISDLGGRR